MVKAFPDEASMLRYLLEREQNMLVAIGFDHMRTMLALPEDEPRCIISTCYFCSLLFRSYHNHPPRP